MQTSNTPKPGSDDEHTAQNYIQETLKSRETARKAIAQATDRQTNRRQSLEPAPEVRQLHEAVMDFYIQIHAKSHRALNPNTASGDGTQIWTKQLTTITLPTDGIHDVGVLNDWGDWSDFDPLKALNTHDIETQDVPVSLDSLWETWETDNTLTLTFKAGYKGEKQTRNYTFTYYLPIAAAMQVFAALNQCLDELGWLPKKQQREIRTRLVPIPDNDELEEQRKEWREQHMDKEE